MHNYSYKTIQCCIIVSNICLFLLLFHSNCYTVGYCLVLLWPVFFPQCFPHLSRVVDCVWNVMAHGQKPDFIFRRNGRVHLNRRGTSVQSTTGSRGVRISGSNAGYTMFWGSVKSTGHPFHSPVSPSLPLPCVTVRHHISIGVYLKLRCSNRHLWMLTEKSKSTYWDINRLSCVLCSKVSYLSWRTVSWWNSWSCSQHAVFLRFYWTALTDPQDTSAAVTQSSPMDVSAQIRKLVMQGCTT